MAASSRIGGVETYLLRLAPHLRRRDHRVLFVTRAGVPLAVQTRALGFETHEWFRGGKNLLTVWKLAHLMRRERVDLVHTHIFSANSLGALAARLAGIPSVARVPATEGAAHYRRSTYVAAVSHNVAAHLQNQGFPAHKIRVFYNGVDWKRFDALPPRPDARRALNLPADAFVLLCAASFTSRKGQRFLLEAAAGLPADVQVLLCGEGGEEASLRALSAQLGMGNRVHFAGFLSDIRPALAASDAFVLPSLHEGLPNSVLEALAARVPAIATDIAGTPEIIETEKTGLLVPPGEVEPLQLALKRFHDDADLRARLACKGRERVETRFDGEKCLDAVTEWLEAIDAAWKAGKTVLPGGEKPLKKPSRSPRFDLLFWALNAAQTFAAPVLLFKKWRRFRARGDLLEWDCARWNAPAEMQNESEHGPHLVLVAMGFAETRLAAQLTAMLREKRPDLQISWSIRNLEAARQGRAVPENQRVVPFPFDYFVPVQHWISAVQPDAVVFIERFQFPIFARALHGRGVKVGAVAARSRQHQGGRYRWGAFYGRWFLGAFDLLCFRSRGELENLGEIPASTRTRVTGSLKFWPRLPEIQPARAKHLKDWLELSKRPLLAAGSTQPGDEAWILEAFAPLREELGARLMLAPRHVGRGDEVEKLVSARGWNLARRSRPSPDDDGADVLLLDTLGELTHAYGAARAAFIGGTLSGTGHNVLEPIAHGIAVFFGPKRGTFAAEQAMCEGAGVGFRVETPAQLTQGWRELLLDETRREEIATKARDFNAEGARAWNATVEAISELLEPRDSREKKPSDTFAQ